MDAIESNIQAFMDAIESNIQALNFIAILVFIMGIIMVFKGVKGGTADAGFSHRTIW